MKKILIALALVILLATAAIGVVMAQDTNPGTPDTPLCPYCTTGGSYQGRGSGNGYLGAYMHAAFAQALGISEEDFEARILAGETMFEIAASLGFDADGFADLHNQARLAALEMAFNDGAIDEDQFQWMKDRMSGGFGSGMGGRGGGGRGYGRHGGGCGGYQPAP